MTIVEHKEREKEEMRKLILYTANEIMASEGLDKISIRKIANRIEYSLAIIYHYFKDKDEIISSMMKMGYQKIINALSNAQVSTDDPVQRMREMSCSYIKAALQMPDGFISVQLNSSPSVLEHTASLFEGASVKKPALTLLFQSLKEILKDKNMDDASLELIAQVIASSTLGLIIKLTVEKDMISEKQKEKLIEHFLKLTIDRMIMGTPLEDL